MRVRKLYLQNFLSYGELFTEFGNGLNILVGRNAVGKTNLLESIYCSSVGKSARGLRDKELIKWETNKSARIRLNIEKKFSNHTIDISIDTQGKKRITVDELPIMKIGELMGVIDVVYFSPTEMKLIKESPSDRRRFMDISLCQQDKMYFYTLVRYNKLLAQRNKLLKEHKNSSSLCEMNEIIVDKMCQAQEYIFKKRKEFLEKLAPIAKEKHNCLTSGKEELALIYESEDIQGEVINAELKKLYEKSFEKDSRLEYTTVGIHRDDIKINIGGVDIRKYGSQGQQRTAVLSMKLAETEMFYIQCGEYPILLLDDVLSELDRTRRKALFESIGGLQTFITCTDFDADEKIEKKIFSIHNGTVTEI